MHGGFETAARWNKHYHDMAERADVALADYILAHAAEIRALPRPATARDAWELYYAWTNATPAARALREQIYSYHGRAWRARDAWDRIREEG